MTLPATPPSPGGRPRRALGDLHGDKTYTVTQADVDAGKVTDTADRHRHRPRPDLSVLAAGNDHLPDPGSRPGGDHRKTATVVPPADQTAAKAGDTIAYAYKVTNTGSATLARRGQRPDLGGGHLPDPGLAGSRPGSVETCTATRATPSPRLTSTPER